MINLNTINGASIMLRTAQIILAGRFEKDLIGVEMGIAYGGGVESLGVLWKGRGKVYGYDTFEELHPEHLATNKFSFEARCMDHWYDPAVFGTKALNYDFQRKQLDTEGLDNVTLIKGLVTKDSCKDLPYIHYAFLDMDMLESMKTGYMAVKDKLVKGSFLFLHDVMPKGHILGLHEWWFDTIMKEHKDEYKVIGQWDNEFLLGIEKIV